MNKWISQTDKKAIPICFVYFLVFDSQFACKLVCLFHSFKQKNWINRMSKVFVKCLFSFIPFSIDWKMKMKKIQFLHSGFRKHVNEWIIIISVIHWWMYGCTHCVPSIYIAYFHAFVHTWLTLSKLEIIYDWKWSYMWISTERFQSDGCIFTCKLHLMEITWYNYIFSWGCLLANPFEYVEYTNEMIDGVGVRFKHGINFYNRPQKVLVCVNSFYGMSAWKFWSLLSWLLKAAQKLWCFTGKARLAWLLLYWIKLARLYLNKTSTFWMSLFYVGS